MLYVTYYKLFCVNRKVKHRCVYIYMLIYMYVCIYIYIYIYIT